MNLKLNEKIRIKLESFDHKLLDLSCKQIIESVSSTESKVVGPIPLPTKQRIYCVLRSPHVNKDSREHFEIRIHKRIIDIYPSSLNSAQSILKINLPSGVSTKIK
jgi:small subunit ribosomal protein S10